MAVGLEVVGRMAGDGGHAHFGRQRRRRGGIGAIEMRGGLPRIPRVQPHLARIDSRQPRHALLLRQRRIRYIHHDDAGTEP
jgi:hypothetical protein